MNTCTGTDVNSSFNDLYKEFRNQLRLYHPLSVIRAALATLRKMSGDRVQDLKMAPWHVLLIVKWILQDKMTGDRPISLAQFDDLRQRLHEFPERMASPAGVPFPLFVRRLVHQQIAFQREMTGGFIREAALLEALPSAHPLRMQFQARAGITPEHFIDLSLATYTAIVVDGKVSLPFNWFASLHETYGPAVLESFYSLASRDFGELRDFCQALRERIPRVASEYYESTPLRRFPFFRSEHGLDCWHPMVFFRGMEAMVHYVLSDAGDAYIEPFSRLFEKHVVDEVFTVHATVLNEARLRDILGRDSRVPDALLTFPEANIFVEAKAGLFDESLMTTADSTILSHKTKALRSAIAQAWMASRGLRQSELAPAQVRSAPIDYLLIVTNRDLETSRGSLLREMYPEGKLDYPDDTTAALLPLERVYAVSVEEFERLIAAARDGAYLPNVLRACVEADAKPETAKFFFEQHLTAQRIPRGRSDLVNKALDRGLERVQAALSS